MQKHQLGEVGKKVPFGCLYFVGNICAKNNQTRMWANVQRDGRPAEHRWRPLFNAAKFG